MATFKDAHGRTWDLSLDTFKIREVRRATCDVKDCMHRPGKDHACEAVDLATIDGEAFSRMQSDVCLLVDVLYLLCHEQVQAKNLTDVDFARGLAGDSISLATKAMLESIADFFQSSRGELVRLMAQQSEALEKIGMEKALARINDPVLRDRIVAAMEVDLDNRIEDALTGLTPATSRKSSPASAE